MHNWEMTGFLFWAWVSWQVYPSGTNWLNRFSGWIRWLVSGNVQKASGFKSLVRRSVACGRPHYAELRGSLTLQILPVREQEYTSVIYISNYLDALPERPSNSSDREFSDVYSSLLDQTSLLHEVTKADKCTCKCNIEPYCLSRFKGFTQN